VSERNVPDGRVLVTYDTAVPQDWFDRVLAATKRSPFGHVVWAYRWKLADGTEVESLFGEPVAVDAMGVIILADMAQEG